MQVKLRIQQGSNAGKEIAVRGSKFVIGRADDCALRPHSDAVSRRHCVVIVAADGVVGVRDLKSRNGTYVNGQRITGDKRLRHGDQLRVGPYEFEVIIQQPKAAPPPAQVSESSVAGGGGESAAMGSMVSQWLEEADDFAREEQRLASPETREYRFDETSRIALETAAETAEPSREPPGPEVDGSSAARRKSKRAKEKAAEAESAAPRFAVKGEQPKDTQEAAAQVLRKFFNRGG
jgi:pSer/pThr/pTyr-binding forkhead associated (FHA) protein